MNTAPGTRIGVAVSSEMSICQNLISGRGPTPGLDHSVHVAYRTWLHEHSYGPETSGGGRYAGV